MSLINKALKQEQMKRSRVESGELPPFSAFQAQPVAPSISGVPMRAPRKDSKGTLILVGFLGMGLLLLVSIGAFLYLGSKYLTQIEETVPSQDAQPNESSFAPTNLVKQALETQKELVAVKDDITEKVEQSPVAPAPKAEPVVLTQQSDTPAEPIEEPKSKLSTIKSSITNLLPGKSKPEFNLETQYYIDSMSLQAVRVSGGNSRFMMNGRVYKIGNTIDHEKGLIFREAFPDLLVFVDPNGHRYEKNL